MNDLELIYEQIYFSNNLVILNEENFFSKLKYAMAVAGVALAGLAVTSSNTEDTLMGGIFSAAKKLSQFRSPTSNISSILRDDNTALEYIKTHSNFVITPSNILAAIYGSNWQNILSQKRDYQANRPEINFLIDLSDEALNTPINVIYKKSFSNDKADTLGVYQPLTNSITINDEGLKRNNGSVLHTLAHELRHALQTHIPSKHLQPIENIKGLNAAGRYVASPAEAGVRLAALAEIYWRDTNTLITNEETAKAALTKYGFWLDTSPESLQKVNEMKLPSDVIQLRQVWYTLLKKSEETGNKEDFNKFYNILIKQMPGLVYNILKTQKNTTA